MPRRSIPRLSMNGLSTLRWSIDEDLYHCRRAGFDAVGVWRQKLVDFGVDRGVELLEESGLRVSNLLWAGGFTGVEGHSLEEAVADATRAIELAELIRADCLVLHLGGRNLHTRRHADRLVRSALEDLLPIAEARHVTLAVEPMNAALASEWTSLTSLEAACKLLDDYRSKSLKMVYSSYHFPKPSKEVIAEIAPRTAVVHLADVDAGLVVDRERRLMGDGVAPLTSTVRQLVAAGFEGCFDVELLGTAGGPAGYERLVQLSAKRGAELLAAAGVSSAVGWA